MSAVRKYIPPQQRPVTKQQVKAMMNSETETKMFFTQNVGNVDFSGSVWPLSYVPQGDTPLTRDGDTLRPKKLEVNYSIVSADTTQLFTVWIIAYHLQGTPTMSTFFTNPPVGAVNAPLTQCSNDSVVSNDLTVHYHKIHAFTTAADACHAGTINVALKGVINFYSSSSTNLKHGLFLMTVSDSGAVSHPTFQFSSCLTFTDA